MEKNVVLVTDSTADIPRTLTEELGIYVIPLKVHFDGETYLDGESITPPLFYQKVSQVRGLP
ncbi:MAG: DegV family protein, partial [Thermicanus sp.]|nr:DegV family protein [Thermicanus sp.]